MPLEVPILVSLPGGDLSILVEKDYHTAWMEGPALEVYRGTLSLGSRVSGITRGADGTFLVHGLAPPGGFLRVGGNDCR